MRVVVQHHPSRRVEPAILREWPDAVIVDDPMPDGPPTPWRTYRRCLQVPADDWLVIVQDDAVPVEHAARVLPSALANRPGAVVCLYVGVALSWHAGAVRQAGAAGKAWARLSAVPWTPIVAAAWPVDLAQRIVADTRDVMPRADDALVGEWLHAHGVDVWATVPCLVEHPDTAPSIVSPNRGTGAWRVSACPPACDVRTVDYAEPEWP